MIGMIPKNTPFLHISLDNSVTRGRIFVRCQKSFNFFKDVLMTELGLCKLALVLFTEFFFFLFLSDLQCQSLMAHCYGMTALALATVNICLQMWRTSYIY